MTKKLLIFDLDGTLLNTIGDLANAVNYALTQCGYATHPQDAFNLMVGNGVRTLISRAVPEGTDLEMQEQILSQFLSYYNTHLNCETRPYTGIISVLQQAEQLGYLLAIASNKYQSGTEECIQTYFSEITFVAISGQRDGIPHKPDPSVITNLMTQFGVKAEETVMIGDSWVDIQTAKSAHVTAIGVTWGFRGKEELEQAGADHIINRPEELFDIIK